MSRRRNYNVPGHAHELTFSCYRRLPLLRSDRTCRWLAESIDETRESLAFDLRAYVFMPDHVHLLIRPRREDYDIADIRKAIKAPVARRALAWIDKEVPEWSGTLTRTRGARVERLFWQSGGGYDRNVTEPSTLVRMIDCLHANPVRRELVERPHDWPWSSARQFDGYASDFLPIESDASRMDCKHVALRRVAGAAGDSRSPKLLARGRPGGDSLGRVSQKRRFAAILATPTNGR